MALFSKTLTGLLNGVSRQPFAMRLESQGEEQINCISSVAKGVRRRPGLQLVASISVSPVVTDAWHWIDRSPTQRYLVRVANNSTTMGVTDLIAGTSVVVTGNAYTTVSGAATYLRFLTIGDETYIVNTTKQPIFHDVSITGSFACVFAATGRTITVAAGGLINAGFRAGQSLVVTNTTYNSFTYTIADVTDTVLTLVEPPVNETDGTTTLTAQTCTPSVKVWGYVWVKAAIPSADYNINLCLQGGTSRNANYPSPTGLSGSPCTTAIIATGLAAAINAGSVMAEFDAMAYGSLVVITGQADQQTTDFTISTSDGWGDQAMVAVKNGAKVQSFATLPPTGVDGMTVEVDGDQETSVDSYWVKFVVAAGTAARSVAASPSIVSTAGGVARGLGTGVWEECAKPSVTTGTTDLNTLVPQTINAATMPQKLVWNGTAWSVTPVIWGTRTVGDNLTAPKPDFLSDYTASLPTTAPKISDIAFFKNRLALISGESVSFSGVNDYTSFFPTTVVSVADDDAFDVVANFPDVAKLRYAIPFADQLVLFAESGIFGIKADQTAGLTPKSVTFERLTNFTGTPSTRPVIAGDRIFFTEDQNSRSVMREFRRDPSSDTAYVVESISEHIVDYIGDTALRSMAADPVTGMLSVVGGTWGPKTWIYQWFDSNREKVQSAWHAWSLNGDYSASDVTLLQVLSTAIIKGDVYYTLWMPRTGNTSITVVKCPFDPVVYSGSDKLGAVVHSTNDCVPYCDYWTLVTGTTVGGNAVFDITCPINAVAPTASTDLVALAYGSAWSALAGTEIAGGVVSNVTDLTMRLTFTGTTYSGRQLIIGTRSRAYYDFTPPVKKNQNNTPELSGRYFARRWRARFVYPTNVVCHQSVGPSTTGNRTHAKTLSIANKYMAEFPIHREIDSTLNTGFYTEHATAGFELWSVEWDVEWSPRARSL